MRGFLERLPWTPIVLGAAAVFFYATQEGIWPFEHKQLLDSGWEYLGVESSRVLVQEELARLAGLPTTSRKDRKGRVHWYVLSGAV